MFDALLGTAERVPPISASFINEPEVWISAQKPSPAEASRCSTGKAELQQAINYMTARAWRHHVVPGAWRLRLVAGSALQREIRKYRDDDTERGRARHIAGQAILKISAKIGRDAFRMMARSRDDDVGSLRAYLEELRAVMSQAAQRGGEEGLRQLVEEGVHGPVTDKRRHRRVKRWEAAKELLTHLGDGIEAEPLASSS
ncbi:hypothetical protein [Caulobacter flavus]|uniref:hypothetical protein n=1 Tax=Caulobacter flavus TaxID=1679497 RepID=UPI0013DE70FF|nr:hypothetical protein [Caulobacter flavus]